MKKLKNTLISLMVCLTVIGGLNFVALVSKASENAGTGWYFSSIETWNPGAISISYRSKGYFLSNVYDGDGQMYVTASTGSYTKSSDYVYDGGSYITVTATFYAPNNSKKATQRVEP